MSNERVCKGVLEYACACACMCMCVHWPGASLLSRNSDYKLRLDNAHLSAILKAKQPIQSERVVWSVLWVRANVSLPSRLADFPVLFSFVLVERQEQKNSIPMIHNMNCTSHWTDVLWYFIGRMRPKAKHKQRHHWNSLPIGILNSEIPRRTRRWLTTALCHHSNNSWSNGKFNADYAEAFVTAQQQIKRSKP